MFYRYDQIQSLQALWDGLFCYPDFTDEKTEVQKGGVSCLEPQAGEGQVDSRGQAFSSPAVLLLRWAPETLETMEKQTGRGQAELR